MVWTTPHTWIGGELPLARQFNTELRDNLRVTAPFLVEAAGDFIVGSAANDLRRIAIGAVGSVLMVNTAGVWQWSPQVIPAGAIIFYNGTSCPSGYTIVSGARGRMIVGLPASGTLAGTVGSALTNLATRTITTVAAHTHTGGTYQADSGGAHTHTVPGSNTVGGEQNVVSPIGGDSRATSGGNIGTHTATGSSASSGSASVDVTMPYIQYLICSKD